MTFHSWAIEGAEISLETKADLVEFAMGDISSDEAIRRTRARYGLE
ncbi:MAG: antitoxin VbhA family protein [Leifsonia sp.]